MLSFSGGCQADGLYYQDDTTFVMCSNGYPHQQPCPLGTKTSGSPSYKPGYYYGYTDLCSVNLVDYGLSPEYYAPVGYPSPASKDSYDGSQRGGKDKGDVYSKQLTTSFEKQSNGYGGGGHQAHIQKVRNFNLVVFCTCCYEKLTTVFAFRKSIIEPFTFLAH